MKKKISLSSDTYESLMGELAGHGAEANVMVRVQLSKGRTTDALLERIAMNISHKLSEKFADDFVSAVIRKVNRDLEKNLSKRIIRKLKNYFN